MPLTIFCAWPARRCNWRSARSNYAKSYTARRSCRGACAKHLNYKQAADTAALQRLSAHLPWQFLRHKLVRVINHFAQLRVWNSTVELDGVPMFFVHVVAGTDLLVSIAQFESQVRITFQIRRRWDFIEWREREYFTGHLKNENVFSERCALDCSELAKAVIAEGFQIHQEIRDLRMPGRSLIATRSCFMESRSRNVTVSPSAASFSPSVSKSTVTPNGVPISSWRR